MAGAAAVPTFVATGNGVVPPSLEPPRVVLTLGAQAEGYEIPSLPGADTVASFVAMNRLMNLVDCMKDGSVGNAPKVSQQTIRNGAGLFTDQSVGKPYERELNELLQPYLVRDDAQMKRRTWTKKGQKRNQLAKGAFMGLERAKRETTGYVVHDAGMLATSCMLPENGFAANIVAQLKRGKDAGTTRNIDAAYGRLRADGYADCFVNLTTFGSYIDASESGTKADQWYSDTNKAMFDSWPRPGHAVDIAPNLMNLFGVNGTTISVTKTGTEITPTWNYMVDVDEGANGFRIGWDSSAGGPDPNLDLYLGNTEKNNWIVGTAGNAQGKAKRLIMKLLGDKLQVVYFFLNWLANDKNSRQSVLMTNDRVVFLLSLILGVRCAYTGVSKQISPQYRRPDEVPDKMYAVTEFIPIGDKVAAATQQFERTKNAIMSENALFMARLEAVIADPTLVNFTNGSQDRYVPSGFFQAIHADTTVISQGLGNVTLGAAVHEVAHQQLGAGTPRDEWMPDDADAVAAFAVPSTEADLGMDQDRIDQFVWDVREAEGLLKQNYLLIDVLGWDAKGQIYRAAGLEDIANRAYFSAGVYYTLSHDNSQKNNLMAYLSGLSVVTSSGDTRPISEGQLARVSEYSMHALGKWVSKESRARGQEPLSSRARRALGRMGGGMMRGFDLGDLPPLTGEQAEALLASQGEGDEHDREVARFMQEVREEFDAAGAAGDEDLSALYGGPDPRMGPPPPPAGPPAMSAERSLQLHDMVQWDMEQGLWDDPPGSVQEYFQDIGWADPSVTPVWNGCPSPNKEDADCAVIPDESATPEDLRCASGSCNDIQKILNVTLVDRVQETLRQTLGEGLEDYANGSRSYVNGIYWWFICHSELANHAPDVFGPSELMEAVSNYIPLMADEVKTLYLLDGGDALLPEGDMGIGEMSARASAAGYPPEEYIQAGQRIYTQLRRQLDLSPVQNPFTNLAMMVYTAVRAAYGHGPPDQQAIVSTQTMRQGRGAIRPPSRIQTPRMRPSRLVRRMTPRRSGERHSMSPPVRMPPARAMAESAGAGFAPGYRGVSPSLSPEIVGRPHPGAAAAAAAAHPASGGFWGEMGELFGLGGGKPGRRTMRKRRKHTATKSRTHKAKRKSRRTAKPPKAQRRKPRKSAKSRLRKRKPASKAKRPAPVKRRRRPISRRTRK